MKYTQIVLAAVAALVLTFGCSKTQQTGFLTSYANLQQVNPSLMRFSQPERVAHYDKFIVDPVSTRLYDSSGKGISPEDIAHLEQYMYTVLCKDLSEAGFALVTEPGPGVARIRIALTNLKKSSPALKAIPQGKLVGLGLGEASVEGEMLDSLTNEQIAAVIDSEAGRFSFSGLDRWGDVEKVMRDWSSRTVKRITAAHEKAGSP